MSNIKINIPEDMLAQVQQAISDQWKISLGKSGDFISNLCKERLKNKPYKLHKGLFVYDIWTFQQKTDKDGNEYIIFETLYRSGIFNLIGDLRFFRRKISNIKTILITENTNIIEEVSLGDVKNAVFDYVNAIPEHLTVSYQKAKDSVSRLMLLETFHKQHHLIINKNASDIYNLHTRDILKDNRFNTYIEFQNCIVQINKNDGIQIKEYKDFSSVCIWKEHIIQKEFKYIKDNQDSHIGRFFRNVCNEEKDRVNALRSAAGYLMNNYSNPSKGQAVICYDEEITDLKNPKGGTGKGVFANAVKEIRNTAKIDGQKFNPNDKFCFQAINQSTQIVWLDDPKAKLDFDRFKSFLTDGVNAESKNIPEFYFEPEESPKLLICTNSGITSNGSTRKRRQFILEFSNHYSKHIKTGIEEPIIDEHGCVFFSEDWDQEEWNKFYSFMIDCALYYFQYGLQVYEYRSVNENKLRQSVGEDFYNWINDNPLKINTEYTSKDLFKQCYPIDLYADYYKDDNPSTGSLRKFTNSIKNYANIYGFTFDRYTNNGTSCFKLGEKPL